MNKSFQKTYLLVCMIVSILASAQMRVIPFKYDTVYVNKTDSIYYIKGNELIAEIKYGNNFGYSIIFIDSGYINKVISINNNGLKKSESNFKMKKLHGISKEWYESGFLKSEINYSHGLNDGSFIYYYSNGIKEFEGAFLADSSCLISNFKIHYNEIIDIFEHQTTTVTAEKHAPPHGKWKFYNPQGKLSKTFIFEKGILVSLEVGDHFDE